MKDFELVSDKNNCSGCRACQYVCSQNAISYEYDNEGFCYPHIDELLCVDCGQCRKSCAFQTGVECQFIKKHFAVKHKDLDVRKSSRSGGAFVAISDYVIESGGVVYGAAQVAVDTVKHIRATDKKKRDLMCGSKYVQSNIDDVYESINSDLNNGRLVLFSGTPCQSGQVRKIFPPKKYPNLLICDFLCHGVPSQMVWSDYIKFWEKKTKSRVVSAIFRDKSVHTWESHVEKIQTDKKTFYSRRFANLFCSNHILRPSCYSCKYTKMERVSDFTLADFWGIDKINTDFKDDFGVSLLIINDDKAMDVFEMIESRLDYFETTDLELTHYNLKRPSKAPIDRELFWEDYCKYGFSYVSKKYGGYSILRKIKNKILNNID